VAIGRAMKALEMLISFPLRTPDQRRRSALGGGAIR
jgi:hypothetical protein